MIQFRNICKNYGSKFVLNNISFTIDKGEVFVLLGPSGCGKSTSIKLINKLLVPDSGQIFINNEDIALINDLDLRKKIGYVIQNVGLFPHMNVEKNIAIVPKLLRLDKDEIHKKIMKALRWPASLRAVCPPRQDPRALRYHRGCWYRLPRFCAGYGA